MNFSLRTAFAVSHRFWIIVISFLFVSRNFLISSLISFLDHLLFSSILFNLHEFECFWVFPWGWFLVSVPCGQKKCFIWFQCSWIIWGLFCVLSCGLSLKMFHVHLKRMYFASLGWKALYISVKSISSRVLFNDRISLVIFCLEDLSFYTMGC